MDSSSVLDLSAPGPEYSQDPYPLFASLRAEAPVRRAMYAGLLAWLVTRADDMELVFTDPRFSTNPHNSGPDNKDVPWLFGVELLGLSQHMAVTDPPDHTRLRKAVSKVFTPRRIETLRPMIQQVTDDLIGKFLSRGSVDLLSEFAWPLPGSVISEIVGVPQQDSGTFKEWILDAVGPDATDLAASGAAFAAIASYLTGLIESKRAHGAIGPSDLLADLVAAQEHDGGLTDEELRSLAFGLLVGGFESVAILICNGMLALLQHPDQMALLRARPELTGQAVEEFLRYDAPADTAMPRFAKEDVRIGDTLIRAGEAVLCVVSSANRDLPMPGDLNTLDISRPEIRHMSFGHGMHYCIGAHLARLELAIAFRTLLDRCQNITLAADPGELVKRPAAMTRRLPALPIKFTPA